MSDIAFDAECIFCRIAAREIPAEILHVSDTVVAFRDLNPQAPVHIVLIPKEHIPSAAAVEGRNGGVLADLVQAASHLADAEGISAGGWRLVTNTGPDAGQSVFHLHFHLIPVHERQPVVRRNGRRVTLRFVQRPAPREELERVAQEIRDHLPGGRRVPRATRRVQEP